MFRRILWKLKHNFLWDIDGIPGSIWWKARKDFKRPVVKFYVLKKQDYLHDYLIPTRGFLIMNDMDWKTKWGTYRFEWLPHITIRAFGKCFVWTFESPNGDNTTYYETIMDYLWNYDKDIGKTKENYGWKRLDENNRWISTWDDSIVKKLNQSNS